MIDAISEEKSSGRKDDNKSAQMSAAHSKKRDGNEISTVAKIEILDADKNEADENIHKDFVTSSDLLDPKEK